MLKSLQATTDRLQSTLFKHTWKTRTTEKNDIPACRSSGKKTETGCTSWPTPLKSDPHRSEMERLKKDRQTRNPDHIGNYRTELPDVAQLASWPTPRAEDGESAGMRHSRGVADTLTAQASWATSSSRDWKDVSDPSTWNCKEERERMDQLGRQVLATASGPTPSGSPAGMERRGQLNPAFSRWLMGLPPVWDDCGAMVMRSVRRSRKSS